MARKSVIPVPGLALALTGAAGLLAWADTGESPRAATPAATASAAATQPATSQPARTAEEVIQDLLRQRRQPPVVEPVRRPVASPVAPGAPASDPAVVGTAPDAQRPRLRDEGDFINGRRGRVVRAADGRALFAFDADARSSAEAPMVLAPCRKTQSMEDAVREQGDRLVFEVSGQVLTYRGANYLLPTIVEKVADRGNLQP